VQLEQPLVQLVQQALLRVQPQLQQAKLLELLATLWVAQLMQVLTPQQMLVVA
jgi:hypothetical protein